MARLASSTAVVRLIYVLAACALAACGADSPRADFARDLKQIVSWASASRFIVDRWERRAVPGPYTLDALEKAQQDVRQQIQSLDDVRDIDAVERDQARQAAEQVVTLCGRLRDAVARANGAETVRTSRQLADIENRLRLLADSEASRR